MKINRKKILIYWPLFSLFLLAGCNGSTALKKEVRVKNTLDFNRISETVSIPMTKLKDLTAKYSPKDLLVQDPSTGNYLVRQLVDENQDGQPDELLFQVSIKANEAKTYQIIGRENGSEEQPHSKYTTFSRFVPERIDDYAWENDKVAFRTFGPKAQQLTEEHKPGGTLTSGIDLWFKRVKYPIIDECMQVPSIVSIITTSTVEKDVMPTMLARVAALGESVFGKTIVCMFRKILSATRPLPGDQFVPFLS